MISVDEFNNLEVGDEILLNDDWCTSGPYNFIIDDIAPNHLTSETLRVGVFTGVHHAWAGINDIEAVLSA